MFISLHFTIVYADSTTSMVDATKITGQLLQSGYDDNFVGAREINEQNCLNFFTTAITADTSLELLARQFISQHFEKVALSEGFMLLSEEMLGFLLDDDTLLIGREQRVLEALLRWMRCGTSSFRGMDLLRRIRSRITGPTHSPIAKSIALHAASNRREESLSYENLEALDSSIFQTPQSPPAPKRIISAAREVVRALAAVCDGSAVCSGDVSGKIRMWDAATLAPRGTLAEGGGDEDGVYSLAEWGGLLASGHAGGWIRLWDVAARTCVGELKGHADGVYALAARGPALLSGSYDRTVRVWRRGGDGGVWERTLEGHASLVTSVAAGPGGRAYSGSMDRTVRVWDASTGAHVGTLHGHAAGVCGLAVGPGGGRLVTSAADGGVRVWCTRTLACVGASAAAAAAGLFVGRVAAHGGRVYGGTWTRGAVGGDTGCEVLAWELKALEVW